MAGWQAMVEMMGPPGGGRVQGLSISLGWKSLTGARSLEPADVSSTAAGTAIYNAVLHLSVVGTAMQCFDAIRPGLQMTECYFPTAVQVPFPAARRHCSSPIRKTLRMASLDPLLPHF